MRVIFMGTPDFAVLSLKKLIDEQYNVVAVFSQPDKPKGRGHKVIATPVKQMAIDNGMEVFQPISLRTDETIDLIKSLEPDIIIVVAYGKILPMDIINTPKYGCINIHGSLLPKYRGAAPIQWSILNGDTVTGITSMFMAKEMDTGDILLQDSTPIFENETSGELFQRLAVMGSSVLSKTIKDLEKGQLKPIKQDDNLASYAPMLSKEISFIDFSKTAKEVHNLIRGLSPWPVANTTLFNKKLKVYNSSVVEKTYQGDVGSIACNKEFIVICGDNIGIKLEYVQYDSSKKMSGADFLRGRKIDIGFKFI